MNDKVSAIIQEKDQKFYSQERHRGFGIVPKMGWILIEVISFSLLNGLYE